MDNVTNKQLSWPQRNWLILCIIVAILSPVVVNMLQAGAHKINYNDATHPIMSDTSYKMSSPPGNTGKDSAGQNKDTTSKK